MNDRPSEEEEIVRSVLDPWKAAVDAHQPQQVASVFTEDAIFQGLRPYTVGRQGIADYYDSQPFGMTVAYRFLETRRLAEGLVSAYLRVDFSFVDRPTLGLYLSVLVKQVVDGWFIAQYQISKL